MDVASAYTKAKEFIDNSKQIYIAIAENPSSDAVGSALILYQGLTDIGKKVVLACPDLVTVAQTKYISVNKISTEFSRKNFVISLDYQDGSIEKVSYNIKDNKFNLVIEPRSGFDSLKPDKVSYSYSGAETDLIILVGVADFGKLQFLYDKNKDLFAKIPVINIDNRPGNISPVQVNLVETQRPAIAEIAAYLLKILGVQFSPDISSNILNALHDATDNFLDNRVSDRTYELAAACLRYGAKLFRPSVDKSAAGSLEPGAIPQKPKTDQGTSSGKNILEEDNDKKQISPDQRPAAARVQNDDMAPEEWLKPKIFKSTSN